MTPPTIEFHPQEIVLFVVVESFHRCKAALGGEFFDIGATRQGEHANVDFAKLTAAAGLLFVSIHAVGIGLDRFSEGDFWFLSFRLPACRGV